MAENTTVKFGVGSNASIGLIQKIDYNKSVEIAEARNTEGLVVARKAFSTTSTVTIEALVDTDFDKEVGDTLTLTDPDFTGVITSIVKTSSNTDFQSISVTAESKDGIGASKTDSLESVLS